MANDPTQFAETINELFNAIKHHAAHEETHALIADKPIVTSFFVKHNNPNNDIIFHNHYAVQLIMGYQDWVKRVLKNIQIWQEQ